MHLTPSGLARALTEPPECRAVERGHPLNNLAMPGPQLRARGLAAQRGEVAIAVAVLNRRIRVAKPVSVRVA